MEEKKILDVLEPYEGELLFSWVIRMANHYGIYSLPEKDRKQFKKELFGEFASEYPRIYFEQYLSVLVKKISLPNSKYFGNVYNVLDKMTVYPFYECFMEQLEIEKTLSKFLEEEPKKTTIFETIPGMDVKGIYYRKASGCYLKYCPECIKAHGLYLLREHQIPEIQVCYEHGIFLKQFQYKNWDNLNFIVNIPKFIHEENVKVGMHDVRYQIAIMIHKIFQEGFQDSPAILKAKIRKRLQQLGYLSEKNYFFCFKDFYDEMECGDYFHSVEQAGDSIYHGIFTTKSKKFISAVDYFFLIIKLFGDLDEYYCFSVSEKDIANRFYHPKHQGKLFMGTSFQQRYLTTAEYGKKYGKDRVQIRNYCAEGRIDGVIHLNGIWLIPENAPYPEDKRFKHQSSDL